MKFTWFNTLSKSAPKTVGPLITVSVPMLGVRNVTAKVDTGAFSGALHASGMRVITDANGVKQLQFLPHGKKKTVLVERFHRRGVRSSNGQVTNRYAFETEIEILGQSYPITITLSDRSTMKYPMLIGRKFLRTHGFLVDVSMNNQ